MLEVVFWADARGGLSAPCRARAVHGLFLRQPHAGCRRPPQPHLTTGQSPSYQQHSGAIGGALEKGRNLERSTPQQQWRAELAALRLLPEKLLMESFDAALRYSRYLRPHKQHSAHQLSLATSVAEDTAPSPLLLPSGPCKRPPGNMDPQKVSL